MKLGPSWRCELEAVASIHFLGLSRSANQLVGALENYVEEGPFNVGLG